MSHSDFLGQAVLFSDNKKLTHTKPRMERMRGEVLDVAAVADQELYETECDGIAAFRRSLSSLIGALEKGNNAEAGVI